MTITFVVMFAVSPLTAVKGELPRTGLPTYTLVDLGTLPGYDHGKALAVNNAGEVVGLLTNDVQLGPNHAFIWREGVMTPLGTLGGDGSTAVSVNEGSTVAGLAQVQPGPGSPTHAFVWKDGVMDDLGTLGGSASWANCVTTSGLVVGGSRLTGDSAFHPVVWQEGAPRDLGILPGHWVGDARAMNTSGKIVGYSTTVFSKARAVLWDMGPQDLGTLSGGCCSEALDVNDAGQVVGFSWLDSNRSFHAVVWENRVPFDLGPLVDGHNSRAHAVNANADVVGVAWVTSNERLVPRATLWQGEWAVDLNCLIPLGTGWTITEARDINDAGEIVGFGINAETGVTHGLLLRPAARATCDFDVDGDVDLSDFALLSDRLQTGGPAPGERSLVSPVCARVYDLDENGCVDLRDFAVFQLTFGHSLLGRDSRVNPD